MTEQIDAQAERRKRINARKEMLARRMPQLQRVRVVPKDEDIRMFIKHPSGGGFPESGSAEWPLDRFTRRRLMDGSVTLEGEPKGAARPAHQSHRSQ
jgi:hypothetical protein